MKTLLRTQLAAIATAPAIARAHSHDHSRPGAWIEALPPGGGSAS